MRHDVFYEDYSVAWVETSLSIAEWWQNEKHQTSNLNILIEVDPATNRILITCLSSERNLESRDENRHTSTDAMAHIGTYTDVNDGFGLAWAYTFQGEKPSLFHGSLSAKTTLSSDIAIRMGK
jgi:hypothetical protein